MKKANFLKTASVALAFLASTTAFSLGAAAKQDQAEPTDKIENVFNANNVDGSVDMTVAQIMGMSDEEADAYAVARINKHIEGYLSKADKNGELKSEEKLQRDYSVASFINKIFFKDNVLGQPGKLDQIHGAYNTLMVYIGGVANDRPDYTFDQMMLLTIKKYYQFEQEQKKKQEPVVVASSQSPE